MVNRIDSGARMFLFAAHLHINTAVGFKRQKRLLPDKSKTRRGKPTAVDLF